MSDIVVCCTDGSDLSAQAIEAGLSLLDRERWRVLLVICVPETAVEMATGAGMAPGAGSGFANASPTGREVLAAQEHLKEMGEERAAGVAARVGLREDAVRVLVGPPGPTVVDYLRETEAALVVAGSRGLGGAARLLLGSMSEHLVRHAPCPVLIGGEDIPAEPAGQVVLCVDGSEHSLATGAAAVDLFAPGLPYAVATVLPISNLPRSESALGELQDLDRQAAADRILVAAATAFGVPDTELIALDGNDPADALVELAGSRPVRVLVVGTHGHGLVGRALVGSVAERLLRHAPTLVLVVPRH